MNDASISSFSKLFIPNDRNFEQGDDPSVPLGASVQSFPNLGIGCLKSSMIKFNSNRNSLAAVKMYFAGSNVWRHSNQTPYADSGYSAVALPLDLMIDCSDLNDSVKKEIKEK